MRVVGREGGREAGGWLSESQHSQQWTRFGRAERGRVRAVNYRKGMP